MNKKLQDRNYFILTNLLDRNCIVEYEIHDYERVLANHLTKSETIDYLLENNLVIDDISINGNCDFLLMVTRG